MIVAGRLTQYRDGSAKSSLRIAISRESLASPIVGTAICRFKTGMELTANSAIDVCATLGYLCFFTDLYQRAVIRERNAAAWQGKLSFRLANALDSSLKKNTAFIKKARLALTNENLISFRSDIENLSLEKYISEIVSAVAEGLGKVKANADIIAATEIVSLLHQRFATQFTPFLAFHVVRGLAPATANSLASQSSEQREKEESSRILKQRALLRVATELWLLNVFRSIQDAIDGSGAEPKKRKLEEALPIFCLRELLAPDAEFSNIGIATTFVKNFSKLIGSNDDSRVISPEEAENIRLILEKYFTGLADHLIKQNRYLIREASRVEDSTMTYGSIPASRENELLELQKTHDKQISSAQVLAAALHLPMPDLHNETQPNTTDGTMIRGFGSSKPNGEPSLIDDVWEDEDQRRFYEVLVELHELVPSDMLTEVKIGGQLTTTTTEMKALQTKNLENEYEDSFEEADFDTDMNPEEEVEQPSATIGAKVDALLIRLSDMNNRELIDNAAIEFAFLNSKASRNRLSKTLLSIPPNRVDILPYLSRLIAILSRYLPTIGEGIVAKLHRDCRRFVKNKGLNKDISLRMYNIRYLSELIKFRVVPIHITLHCLRIILENFTKPDIEILASMLENCGRFLLRSEATSGKMQELLEILMRKAKHVSGVERSLIENAFYYVNPPERSNIARKQRSPTDQYMDKLVYADLSKKTYDKVLRQLKKLDWYQSDGRKHLFSIFTKVWKIKYSNTHLLALLLSGLVRLHSQFVVRVLDTVFENIRRGMEENKFRDNQKRIATIKYLGDLYNYKLVDASQVFDTLYLVLSFGHPQGRPGPGGSAADPDEDYFRIRMIVTLLDSCGSSFDHGPYHKKLDIFLCFLQYYMKTKSSLPLDIEFAIRNTLTRVRPDLRLCSTLAEAASELDEALQNTSEPLYDNQEVDQESSSTSSPVNFSNLDEDEMGEPGDPIDDNELSDDSRSADEEEQHYVLLEKKRVQDDLDRQAEEDLEREFGKMMTESLETRKAEHKKPMEINLPRKQSSQQTQDITRGSAKAVVLERPSSEAVTFTFLPKQGKPRSLNLPSDSALALHSAAQKSAELEEKKTIRELTLKYEGAQTREDLDEVIKKTGINVR